VELKRIETIEIVLMERAVRRTKFWIPKNSI
jgi:hypothetical protein